VGSLKKTSGGGGGKKGLKKSKFPRSAVGKGWGLDSGRLGVETGGEGPTIQTGLQTLQDTDTAGGKTALNRGRNSRGGIRP